MPEGSAAMTQWRSRILRATARYALICAVALAVFSAVLLLAGKDPLRAFADTFRATLGNAYGFSELVVRMIPLLLAAVAVALPARLGLINVGGEGQLYMGAWMASAGAFLLPGAPAWILLPFVAPSSTSSAAPVLYSFFKYT